MSTPRRTLAGGRWRKGCRPGDAVEPVAAAGAGEVGGGHLASRAASLCCCRSLINKRLTPGAARRRGAHMVTMYADSLVLFLRSWSAAQETEADSPNGIKNENNYQTQ